jgi:phytoene dehydrogenase-like protein
MEHPIIIGAGHNGLVAAFYLARAGFKPLVLERCPVVGGVAAGDAIAPGVTAPGLAHQILLRPSIVADMRLTERGIEFVEPDPAVLALGADGRHVSFHRDLQRTQHSLATLSRHDAERYPEFAATLTRLAPVLREVLEMTPPDVDQPDRHDLWKLLTAGRRFRALSRADAFRLLRWMPMAVADLVSEYFQSDLVQATIASRALVGTNLGPWSAGSGALLLIHAASDPQPAGSSISAKTGVAAVMQAMAAAATEAGAEIRTNASVARIEAGLQGVEAVRLESGETIRTSAVVSSADPRRTFLALLDPTVLEPGFVHRVTNYRSRGTTAKVDLVVSNPPFRNIEPGRVYVGPGIDYLERAFDASKYGRWSERPWLDIVVAPGSTPSSGTRVLSILAHFAPYRLRESRWEDTRERFGDVVVRTLEEHAPGLSASIVSRRVLTPEDLEQRYALTGGHIHHGEPGLDQLFIMRPVMGWARYHTPVKGLYLCGGGTHPGLGLTGGSGQNAAREIARHLAKSRRRGSGEAETR